MKNYSGVQILNKTLVLFIAGLMLLTSCQQEKNEGEIIIRLEENTFFEGPIYLDELKVRETQRLDSMLSLDRLKEGFHIDADNPGLYLLRDIRGKSVLVYAIPGQPLQIRFPGGEEGIPLVEGPEASRALDRYFHRKAADEKVLDSLGRVFRESRGLEDFPQIRERLDSAYYALVHHHRSWVESLIRENDTSLFSVFLFNQRFGQQRLFDEEKDLTLMARMAGKLAHRFPDNIHTLDLRERLAFVERSIYEREQALQGLTPGKAFGEISLPDINGQTFSLSRLQGQNVLVHFWAATDAESRRENLKMKSFRKKYPRIALVSVSMDNNREAWQAAVRLDGLDGINVSELLGSDSPLTRRYLPEMQLPVYYLLDESGMIQLRAFSLQRVEEFLESKQAMQ